MRRLPASRHPSARRTLRPAWVLALALAPGPGLAATAGATAESCASWPGELAPLPDRNDPDPLRARWARLRAAELVAVAAAIPVHYPSEAYRIWTHVLCLDPASEEARRRLAALPPKFEIHAPDPAVDRKIRSLEQMLARAEFRLALERASEMSIALTPHPNVRSVRVRVAIVRGVALAALGRVDEAVEAFQRALREDPAVRLPRETSPKLLRLIERARHSEADG